MVYAELIHNPYLLSTIVSFNGQSPRINSQIEKYENKSLAEWVRKVPKIFYDEMNGYDFDLYFTGTPHDYEAVVRAFEKAGVTADQVRLYLKNELENADIKSKEIDTLIEWIKINKNRKFDANKFFENNEELFEGTYPYIVIRGTGVQNVEYQTSIEVVNSAEEISGTLLTNTPILFYVDEATMKQFRTDLLNILQRNDVDQKQLFFMFHPHINAEQVRRVICDLGVETPQIVASVMDEPVKIYLRNYPITEYIRQAIKVFHKEIEKIAEILEKENEESTKTNAEIHKQIERLDDIIHQLKIADMYFTERDNFNAPSSFEEIQQVLIDKIQKWRNRKTKITGDYEIEIAANEYNVDLSKYINEYICSIERECENVCSDIYQKFKKQYDVPGIDLSYRPLNVSYVSVHAPVFSSILPELLDLKEVSYENAKTDFLNFFLKSAQQEEKDPVRVVTCYYDKWRNKALEIILPVMNEYKKQCIAQIHVYYDLLAEVFHNHLLELIELQAQAKERVSAQLSDDELRLQEDNDWFNKFAEQLNQIERG